MWLMSRNYNQTCFRVSTLHPYPSIPAHPSPAQSVSRPASLQTRPTVLISRLLLTQTKHTLHGPSLSRSTLKFNNGRTISRHSRNGRLAEALRMSRLSGGARRPQASLAVARNCNTQTRFYDRNTKQRACSSPVSESVLVALSQHDASGPRGCRSFQST